MKNFLKILNSSLHNVYPESEIRIVGNLLLEKLTGLSRSQLLANNNLKLSENQQETAIRYLDRLKKHEPIQYVLGETEFYGFKFKVNAAVLIPRHETEELVDWALSYRAWGAVGVHFLDVGTGSGCIAIALKKKFPTAKVTAMDISADALKVAKENAEMNRAEVEFIQDDILNPDKKYRKYDVIVSNPPYIPLSEKNEMDKNVTDFEPHTALFVPDTDPIVFYRKIADFALTHLTEHGALYFETHKDQAQQCRYVFENKGFTNVEVRRDISGNERMVRVRF